MPLALEALVTHYGLWAIFAGAGIEGEAVVITGGVLAQKGLLPIWGVAIAAAMGSCMVDQIWFWLARQFRHARWIEKAKRKRAFQRSLVILERHPVAFTLGFRFIYGMRTVTPLAIAASNIRSRTFVTLNIVSAAIWGPAVAWLGYLFGEALDPWLHDIKSVVIAAVVILAVAALIGAIGRGINMEWKREDRS